VDGIDPRHQESIKSKVANAINFAEEKSGAKGISKKTETGLVKSILAPAGDVKDIRQQLLLASGQGGLESDFLAFDLNGKKLVDPSMFLDEEHSYLKNFSGSVERLIEGKPVYHATVPGFEAKVNPGAQAVRALRTPMELPYVHFSDPAGALSKDLDLLTPENIRSNQKALEQIDKALRNSRLNMGNNLLYERTTSAIDQKISKVVHELPHFKRFVPKTDGEVLAKRFQAAPAALRAELERGLIQIDGPVYHGTKEFKNLVAMLRNSFVMSTGKETGTTAMMGWGAYASETLKVAEGYATNNGAVLELRMAPGSRVLDLNKISKTTLETLNEQAAKSGMDLNWYLHEKYGIQAIKKSHIMILDKTAVSQEMLPKKIEDYLVIYQKKLGSLQAKEAVLAEPLRYLKTANDVKMLESYVELIGAKVKPMKERPALQKIAVDRLIQEQPEALLDLAYQSHDEGRLASSSLRKYIENTPGFMEKWEGAMVDRFKQNPSLARRYFYDKDELNSIKTLSEFKKTPVLDAQMESFYEEALDLYQQLSPLEKNRLKEVVSTSKMPPEVKWKAFQILSDEARAVRFFVCSCF